MSSSRSRCTLDCCVPRKRVYLPPIEHGKCTFRSCSMCLNWHCACTPCGVREKAKSCQTALYDIYGSLNCPCTCYPPCAWTCGQGYWGMGCPEFSLSDVTHEVREEYVRIYEDDISRKSWHLGPLFYTCRAYVGDDNEKVSVKWVRHSHAFEKNHYSTLISDAKNCAKLVQAFMNQTNTCGWKVKVLVPKRARGCFFYGDRCRTVVIEPYLKDFKVFYEGVGDLEYLSGSTYAKVLQALIHFSIRYSKGESMMTNLQGSVDYKKKTIYLSSPEIKKENSYGRSPVRNFLRDHKCSRMCRRC